jgi:ABC-type transport system involved in multi-copper enzyme maturation permease subunit
MSAQTGVSPPSGPASQRAVDRAKFRFLRWESAPNPIWVRELKQAIRLTRTPVILCVLAMLAALLMASLGGLGTGSESPAETGAILFQVFFSLAWFVVTLAGPAVAANSIASEREGRTWEAMLLTGLSPAVIARGKLLAAYTSVSMYIVVLAPVGALPFLFGGVSTTEVVLSFFYLFLIAFVAVAFGLAISSKMESLRGALLVTLLLAFPLSGFAFTTLGVGLSYGAHALWPAVVENAPVWLPTAYDRAPFDAKYAIYLVGMPLVCLLIPAWFLYEVTVANLKSHAEDRSTGLKRWFLWSTPLLALAAVLPQLHLEEDSVAVVTVLAQCFFYLYLALAVFLFLGEPLGPSRRVRIGWERAGTKAWGRFLGPSLTGASTLLTLVGLGAIAFVTAVGAASVSLHTFTYSGAREEGLTQVLLFGLSVAGFHVLHVGLGSWLRVRSSTPLLARVLLFTILFGIAVGPWIVAAVAGFVGGGDNDALAIASPSPFFAFLMLDAVDDSTRSGLVIANVIAAVGWAAVGLVLDLAARSRARRLLVEHEAQVVEAERYLASP